MRRPLFEDGVTENNATSARLGYYAGARPPSRHGQARRNPLQRRECGGRAHTASCAPPAKGDCCRRDMSQTAYGSQLMIMGGRGTISAASPGPSINGRVADVGLKADTTDNRGRGGEGRGEGMKPSNGAKRRAFVPNANAGGPLEQELRRRRHTSPNILHNIRMADRAAWNIAAQVRATRKERHCPRNDTTRIGGGRGEKGEDAGMLKSKKVDVEERERGEEDVERREISGHSQRMSPRPRWKWMSAEGSFLTRRERRAWDWWKDEREAWAWGTARARREARKMFEIIMVGFESQWVGLVLKSRTAGRDGGGVRLGGERRSVGLLETAERRIECRRARRRRPGDGGYLYDRRSEAVGKERRQRTSTAIPSHLLLFGPS